MRNKGRRWATVVATVVVTALLGSLGLWLLRRPGRPLPVDAGRTLATPARQVPAASAATAPAATAQAPVAEDAIAWINGTPLPLTALAQRQAIDRALNALLGIPAADEATALDRLVNEVLLLSAAEAAGFRSAAGALTAEREALLGAHGRSVAELERALQAEGFPLAAFDAYLGNLIVVRDFSAAQAQTRGITAEAFIMEVRQANDVRFAAGDGAALPEAARPTAPPAPTTLPEPLVTALLPTETLPAPIDPPPTPTDEAPRGTGVGQRAPGFALPVLGSEPSATLDLDALRGHPVVLSFWVTWCGHCRAQTPLLVDAHARYAAAGIQFVGVNVRETADVAHSYVTGQGILYPVVMDAEGRTTQQYQVTGFPTTYFIDAEGRVAARHVGRLDAEALEQYLALLLR